MSTVLGGTVFAVGALVLLSFFTLHFGFFHYVHSVFLQSFFPVGGGVELGKGFPRLDFYLEVARRYWVFLPIAFLAERQGFPFRPAPTELPDTSVKAKDIAARKLRNAQKRETPGLMGPYKNVIRMHLLIFFFAAAHFARMDSFAVYAIVYAVYFFPWRCLRRVRGK